MLLFFQFFRSSSFAQMAENIFNVILINILITITFIPAGEIEIEVSIERKIFFF
jgi:hypothetical protein